MSLSVRDTLINTGPTGVALQARAADVGAGVWVGEPVGAIYVEGGSTGRGVVVADTRIGAHRSVALETVDGSISCPLSVQSGSLLELVLRCREDATTGAGIYCYIGTGFVVWQAGTVGVSGATNLGASTTTGLTAGETATYSIEFTGTSLVAKRNGVVIATGTDPNSTPVAGVIGVNLRNAYMLAPFEAYNSLTSALTGSYTLADIIASGALSSGGAVVSGAYTFDDLVASGTLGATLGTLTVPQLKNWTGQLLTAQLVEKIAVLRISDMVLLATFTNQTTDGTTANLVLTGALPSGTPCMVVGFNNDGSARFARPVTVA
jgi:hypothetical protein